MSQEQPRHNFTADFDNAAVGFSIGNGCVADDPNNFITYWVYEGNMDLSCITLGMNNANLKINGTLLYNGLEVSEEHMIEIGRITKNCNDPAIEFE